MTKADPLEITINTQMAPLRAGVLLLTECVVEKKIPICSTPTRVHDTATGGGSCDPALLESQISAGSSGRPCRWKRLYHPESRISVGEEVILLRVQNGQRFIVLSRVFKG